MYGTTTLLNASGSLTPMDESRENCENVITCLMVASQLAEEQSEAVRDIFLTTISALPRTAGEA
tara:strand:+ start:233 stop:424 length:192 start_codon:yes stop_codon:yes gene_type:complete